MQNDLFCTVVQITFLFFLTCEFEILNQKICMPVLHHRPFSECHLAFLGGSRALVALLRSFPLSKERKWVASVSAFLLCLAGFFLSLSFSRCWGFSGSSLARSQKQFWQHQIPIDGWLRIPQGWAWEGFRGLGLGLLLPGMNGLYLLHFHSKMSCYSFESTCRSI